MEREANGTQIHVELTEEASELDSVLQEKTRLKENKGEGKEAGG